MMHYISEGARGAAVGWGTALQTGSLGIRFQMASLEFFYWYTSSSRTLALESTQPLTEMGKVKFTLLQVS
jgi:hypothetical protein